jgi:hypothetical protein
MEEVFSTLLEELPSFLSAVSMVSYDQEQIIRRLVSAERQSPSVYRPARQLFLSVLEGAFSFEYAYRQAGLLKDPIERKCAIGVIGAARKFLVGFTPTRITRLPTMPISLEGGMKLDVTSIFLLHTSPRRLMCLHVWETPLSEFQLSGAGGILRRAIANHVPELIGCELEFISIPLREGRGTRRLIRLDWYRLRPFEDKQLQRFLALLQQAWEEYQRRGPRKFRRRSSPDLFTR